MLHSTAEFGTRVPACNLYYDLAGGKRIFSNSLTNITEDIGNHLQVVTVLQKGSQYLRNNLVHALLTMWVAQRPALGMFPSLVDTHPGTDLPWAGEGTCSIPGQRYQLHFPILCT